MKQRLLVALAIALTMAACSGENSITGSHGDYVLSGQIFAVGNLASSNVAAMTVTPSGGPAVGVEVRVRGTGQSTSTDSQGRFALTGLAAQVELIFTRSDGVNASASVNVAASPVVVVELQKNSATVIPAGQAKKEIEGLITAVSSTSITVNDASTHGPVTATINNSTIIRHGSQMLEASDLKVDDRVHVRAAVNSDGTLTALEIMLQNPADENDDVGSQKELEGPIISISATSITVNDASTHGPVTATINDQTVIRKGNKTLSWTDLKPGDRVHVRTTKNTDGSLTALLIILQNPA